MKAAAVSEIKASLSGYLARVKAGEEVLITDRGKPVARLVPIREEEIDVPAYLIALVRAGLARLGSGHLDKAFWRLHRPRDAGGRALASLLEERRAGR
jgi:prevent-host-death family protein